MTLSGLIGMAIPGYGFRAAAAKIDPELPPEPDPASLGAREAQEQAAAARQAKTKSGSAKESDPRAELLAELKRTPKDSVELSPAARRFSAANENADDEGEAVAYLPTPGEIHDVRSMSPREMAGFAHELYLEGVLKWDEYKMLGFPSELHPDFDKTIGALTGEKAEPDSPRDMIAEWEEKVDFERRHAGEDNPATTRAERVLSVLKWHEIPRCRCRRRTGRLAASILRGGAAPFGLPGMDISVLFRIPVG